MLKNMNILRLFTAMAHGWFRQSGLQKKNGSTLNVLAINTWVHSMQSTVAVSIKFIMQHYYAYTIVISITIDPTKIKRCEIYQMKISTNESFPILWYAWVLTSLSEDGVHALAETRKMVHMCSQKQRILYLHFQKYRDPTVVKLFQEGIQATMADIVYPAILIDYWYYWCLRLQLLICAPGLWPLSVSYACLWQLLFTSTSCNNTANTQVHTW